MANSVLVTGGAGFIGMNMVIRLLRNDYQVTVLDNYCQNNRNRLADLASVKVIMGDIRDKDKVDAACKGQDVVVHLAAQTGIPIAHADPVGTWGANVTGYLNVLESACRFGVTRLVMASSQAAEGNTMYGLSKRAGELLTMGYNNRDKLTTSILRLGNVYGPFSEHKQSVVATFIKNIYDDKPLCIHGDGKQAKNFVYVDDVCNAVMLAISRPCGSVEPYYIAGRKNISINTLANRIQLLAGHSLPIVYQKNHGRPKERITSVNDVSHIFRYKIAHNDLGYEPLVELDQGLLWTYAWYKIYYKKGGIEV